MSSEDVLSEGELDALMESVASTADVPDETGKQPHCKPFDFSTREQTLLAQMPALKNLNEKHCLALAQGISQLYKIAAQVEVEKIQPVKGGRRDSRNPASSGINLLEIAPLNGISFLVLPGELLSFIVDQFLEEAAMGLIQAPVART